MGRLLLVTQFLFLIGSATLPAAGQTASTTRPMFTHQPSVEELFLPDITSGDPAKIQAAIERVEKFSRPHWANRATNIAVILEANLFPQADQAAVDMILYDPETTIAVAQLQKLRVDAFLSENKPGQSIAAAKAYYDASPLADTVDAINLVSLCLQAAHPDDAGIVKRFKLQQASWSAATAQPSAQLGESILAGTEVDGKPFEKAISEIHLTEYKKFVAKGNLLLVSGRASEARTVFEQSLAVASSQQLSDAVENIARAIRAQSGCVGPANAYILSMRDQP